MVTLMKQDRSMAPALRERRRRLGRAARSAGRLQMENLESRTLMSATWNNVDTFQLTATGGSVVHAMASDAAGNVYAAGSATDSAGVQHGIIRKQAAGSSAWAVLWDTTAAIDFSALAVDSSGNVFVAGSPASFTPADIYRASAGTNAFTLVEQSNISFRGLAADNAGNVFAMGGQTTGNSPHQTVHWIVQKWTGTQFTTIDDYVNPNFPSFARNALSATVIPTGPSAGIYVVGEDVNSTVSGAYCVHWFVRKSTDGGANWQTVDNFVYDPNGKNVSEAFAVAGDASGNVYVVGQGIAYSTVTTVKKTTTVTVGPNHWIVRKSGNGGASWTTSDDFQVSPTANSLARAAGVDASGNVYVAGYGSDGTNTHSIVRTNEGGSWTTSDDYLATTSGSFAFTVDTAGNLYTAGSSKLAAGAPNAWFIRSATAVAVPATITPSTLTASSTTASLAKASPAASTGLSTSSPSTRQTRTAVTSSALSLKVLSAPSTAASLNNPLKSILG